MQITRAISMATGLCLGLVSFAMAAPILSDSRIKTLIYNENEVYNVTTHYGYQANIEFGENENVQAVSVGDRIGWQIVPADRRLFIRAMEENAHTNMTVVTNRRAYQFDLRSSSSNAVFGSAELTYVLRFFYPEAQGTQPVRYSAPTTVSRVTAQASRPPITRSVPVTPVAQAPLSPLPSATNAASARASVRAPVTPAAAATRNTRLPPRAPAFTSSANAAPSTTFPAPLPQAVPLTSPQPSYAPPPQPPQQVVYQSAPAPVQYQLPPVVAPQAAPAYTAPLQPAVIPFARASAPRQAALTPPPPQYAAAPEGTVPPPAPVQAAPLSPLQPIATPYAGAPATTQVSATPTPAAPPVNFRYTYSGADAAAPVKIFDDGRSTYFKFEQPPLGTRFSVIAPNGEEYEVPHRFNAEGLAVIDTVAAKVRLTQQKGQVVVYNEVLG